MGRPEGIRNALATSLWGAGRRPNHRPPALKPKARKAQLVHDDKTVERLIKNRVGERGRSGPSQGKWLTARAESQVRPKDRIAAGECGAFYECGYYLLQADEKGFKNETRTEKKNVN